MRCPLGRPDQQAADRVSLVEGVKEPAHLLATPDIAALKFGQGHMARVNVVKNGRDFHISSCYLLKNSCKQ